MRRALFVLIIAAVLVAAGYLLYQRMTTPLPEIASREGNEGLRVDANGDERVVTLAAGNLAAANPTTPAERRTVLENFLRQNGDLFGAPESTTLGFAPAARELTFARNDQRYVLVALYQTFRNAPVIDRIVYGEYALTGERNAELRKVRAQLFQTTALPSPPTPDERLRRDAELLFREEMDGAAADEGVLIVSETPVISVQFNIAGYLVRQVVEHAGGSTTHLAAVVDAETMRVQTVYEYLIEDFGVAEEMP